MRRNNEKDKGPFHGDKWRELYIRQMSAENKAKVPGDKWRELYARQMRSDETSYDQDAAAFTSMSHELKEEGNRLFQRRDYRTSLIKYEKSIKLLPNNHPDIAYLRSNMAECYMQLGISDYPRAIHQLTLALEATPNYTKALLKRARCYEALNMLDLALADVRHVLTIEPNNLMATEIEGRLKRTFERQGSRFSEDSLPLSEYAESSNKNEESAKEKVSAMDKLVVEEEKISKSSEEKQTVKLVFREEIRWAQIPHACNISKLRETISDRFPTSNAVVVKFKDEDGDLVSITTTEELKWARASNSHRSMKLYIVEVDPSQDPFYEKLMKPKTITIAKRNETSTESTCVTNWIVQFATFFKNYVGFDVDAYVDLHEVGVKIYSEAMEETVTGEEAQELFGIAGDKFQELAALALFNCGNVHMSRARRRVYFKEDMSKDSVVEQVKTAYDWAQKEFVTAGGKYEEALKIKPGFHEAVLALAQQQFEQAKLSWYYAVGTGVDLETWDSGEALMLYNSAEENLEKGMKMWDELEKKRLDDLFTQNKIETLLQKMKMDNLFKSISADEVEEQASNIRSQIYVLWGTMLYERSVMEFKLGLPVWHECLEVAVEKFEQAGASSTDIGVMIKNHCSNESGLEGLGFNIDEIVQAWNDMYEAKKWEKNITSFRLEPLLRRRVSKLYYALEGG